MDDVDAVQAQIARNMLTSGDWVSARLDGVKYLEKSPLKYWMMAVSFKVFGPYDWAARIPISLSAILLCWSIHGLSRRYLGATAALYAGLATASAMGLWLFTRILIPDVALTLSITAALGCFLRALEPDTKSWRLYALGMWASIGVGLLLKGLIAAVFPVGTALAFLFVSGDWRSRQTWRRMYILPGVGAMLLIAAPWHIAATLANPPYFDFTMHSESGSYRGFFWFYFFNEHILRFLNLRYPRDYNTVPRFSFWLFHFAWFFPFSAFFIRAVALPFRGTAPDARLRLLALCWIGVVMGFFSLSTTQEYYSMPAYPAFAILLGSAMAAAGDRAWKLSMRATSVISAAAGVTCFILYAMAAKYPAPGDISQALAHNPELYTLSLGHMGDLTIRSFAYLRIPLLIAGVAFAIGAIGGWSKIRLRAVLSFAVMMVLFYQASRQALIAFDPYLGSRAIAEALLKSPDGGLILDDAYYEMSGLFFYTDRRALLLNGRFNNLEYGSYAPGAPKVFIDDPGFVARWNSADRWYVASEDEKVEHLRNLVGKANLHKVVGSGGKSLYVNGGTRAPRNLIPPS